MRIVREHGNGRECLLIYHGCNASFQREKLGKQLLLPSSQLRFPLGSAFTALPPMLIPLADSSLPRLAFRLSPYLLSPFALPSFFRNLRY